MAYKTSVYIRRAEREDLDTVVQWMEDPDFSHFLYGEATRSPRRVREQIITMLGRSPGNTVPLGVYLIIDSTEFGPIGLISLNNISWRNRSLNIDAYVGKKNLRSGHLTGIGFFRATEYAFYELNMHRVNLFVYSFNSPSIRLVERSGAVRELTMKDHIVRDGKFYDLYGYGLLRPEFDKLHAEFMSRAPGYDLESNVRAWEEATRAKETPA